MKRLVFRPLYFCSGKDDKKQAVLQAAYSVFQSGKASISLSQHIVNPQSCELDEFSNYYVNHLHCPKIDPSPFSGMAIGADASTNAAKLEKVLRIIIQASIGKKQVSLDINSLRKNKIIDDLVVLQLKNKYATKSSKIIIDDEVQDTDSSNPEADMTQRLQKNMLQVQKLLQTGCSLSVAYMISNKNVASSIWQTALKRKSKAIHSNIVEKLGNKSQQHKSLEQYVFNNGYRMQHLFLKPYKNGAAIQSLLEADNFNLAELVNVLNIIDFQGKVILQNDSKFGQNVLILEQAFKKGGFAKKKLGDNDGIPWYLFL